MSKKLFFTILTILTLAFSFTYVFAADGLQGAANSVRNVVGGAENVVEDAARDISNASKDATGAVENGTEDMTRDMGNDTADTMMGTQNGDTSYSATRTSADNPTFMGMGSTAWTWLILGIAAIVIIALVWYYSMQLTGNNYDDRNND